MRTILSVVIIIVAAVIGFAMGAGMNEAMGGATLFATIAGFACTIQAVKSKKKTDASSYESIGGHRDNEKS